MAPSAPSLRSLLGLIEQDEAARRLAGRGWPRVRLRSAAAVPDRGARRRRRVARARARRSWWSATIAPRATWRRTCARGLRRGGCATTPRGAWPTSRTWRRRRTWSACAWPRSTPCSGGRRAEPAPAGLARRSDDQPVVVVSAVALSEKVPDPQLAPALVHAARGRAARSRGVRRRARGRGLRAGRPGRGARAVRDAGRAAGRVPRDRGARRAGGHVRRGDRIAAVVLDLHAALAGRRGGGRDRAGGGARRRAPRAGRDRRGQRHLRRRTASEATDAAGHRRAAAGRAIRRAARSDRRRRASSWWPPRRSSRRC